jgi:hypothetical protein
MARLLRAMLPATVGAALLIGSGSHAAAAPTALQLGAVNDIVVDSAHGKVVIAGRANSFINDGYTGGILVGNVNGTGMTKLPGIGDTNSVVLGPDGFVYATEQDGHIAKIDTSTSTVTSFSTGTAGCPFGIAFADTELWFSYGCSPGTDAGLAELSTTDGTVTANVLAGPRQARALLAGVPGQSELLATNIAPGGSDLNLLTVSGTTATVAHTVSSITVADMTVSPDASTVLVANGTNGVTYDVADLSVGALTYDAPFGAADAVAYSADGAYVAVGAGIPGDPDTITTFGPNSSVPIRTYDTSTPGSAGPGQNTIPQQRGLDWSGTAVLGLYADYGDAYPILKVLTDALQTPSTMSLSGPHSATRARQLTITGTLSSGGGLSGATLSVTKTDMDGTHNLPSVVTRAGGAFTIHDTPAVGGTNTYAVRFAGDDTHDAVAKTIKISVSRAAAALSVRTNHPSYNYNGRATVTAHLGGTFSNRKVSIYAKPFGRNTRLVRTANADTHGNVTATVAVTVKTTFKATFGGDERFRPASAATRATVHAKVQTAVAGVQRKDGKYRVYSARNGGGVAVKVSPNKAGENVKFLLQVFRNGAWHTVDTAVESLNSSSVIGVGFNGTKGYHYRVRGQFGGDAANLAEVGAWQYAEFA